MKHIKSHRPQRLKLVLFMLAALAGGAALIAASIWLRPGPAVPTTQAATAPASAPSDPERPVDPKTASAQNVSGLLLLFGLACLLVAVVFAILLIIDIRNARPAWQTQTRYPRRR